MTAPTQIELGRANLERVRIFMSEHLCATQRECAFFLDLSPMAVNRHVKAIRAEWRELVMVNVATGRDILRQPVTSDGGWVAPKS